MTDSKIKVEKLDDGGVSFHVDGEWEGTHHNAMADSDINQNCFRLGYWQGYKEGRELAKKQMAELLRPWYEETDPT